jgi:predicted amidohydrolase YtcJ
MADAGKLPIDVIAFPAFTITDDAVVADVAQNWKKMGRFRLGGVKLITDGAIQSYTA